MNTIIPTEFVNAAASWWLKPTQKTTSGRVARATVNYLGEDFSNWRECRDKETLSFFDLLVGIASNAQQDPTPSSKDSEMSFIGLSIQQSINENYK